MIDRENVIKKLAFTILCDSEASWDTIELPIEQAKDILALLKEQEAVPVIQREIMHMLVWCCGSCGVAITDGDKFCRNCGRRMKWDADGETPIPS